MRKMWVVMLGVIVLAGCGGEAGWREFRSVEGRFAIQLPGVPSEQSQNIITEFGPIEAHVFLVDRAEVGYLVSYADYPTDLVTSSGAQVVLGGISIGVIADTGGNLVSQTDINIYGYAGTELLINSPDGASRLWMRIFLVESRIYQISLVAELGSDIAEDAERFFESFVLLDLP